MNPAEKMRDKRERSIEAVARSIYANFGQTIDEPMVGASFDVLPKFSRDWYREKARVALSFDAPRPTPPADEAHRVLASGKMDEDGCCAGCGRQVIPSPCCPDYPLWPGPCRSCYSDTPPAVDDVARAREAVVEKAKAWYRAGSDDHKAGTRLLLAVERYIAAERAARGEPGAKGGV